MPSLIHVCLWDDNHWERVTASDIAKSHPFVETVSASSKLFMCELCGQYVFYSKGKKRIPCFGHSSGEMIKDCPERTFGYGYTPPYDEKQHELPLKINLNGVVSFSLGLICVPDNLLKKNIYVEIYLNGICNWMYDHLIEYKPFNTLIKLCRGNAVSLEELAEQIFGEIDEETLQAVSVLLSFAALAKNHKGAVLFSARMHMLFKGLSGVYACTNPDCSCHHTYKGITIGKVLLDDGRFTCPECNSMVYELYNDRRCGALYYKGYIQCDTNGVPTAPGYLWHYKGRKNGRSYWRKIKTVFPEKISISLSISF